jgi:hypothetical protein
MKEGLSREVIEDHVSYQARPGGLFFYYPAAEIFYLV